MKLLIRKKPFGALTKGMVRDHKNDIFYTGMALLAEQEATEARMIDMMADAQLAAIHVKRVTLHVKYLHLVNKLTGLGPSGLNNRLASKSKDAKETRSRNKRN